MTVIIDTTDVNIREARSFLMFLESRGSLAESRPGVISRNFELLVALETFDCLDFRSLGLGTF